MFTIKNRTGLSRLALVSVVLATVAICFIVWLVVVNSGQELSSEEAKELEQAGFVVDSEAEAAGTDAEQAAEEEKNADAEIEKVEN